MAQRKRPPARGRQTPRPARPAPRPAANRARQAPAPQPKPFLTPGGSPFRHAVERRSATVAVFLHGLPRALPGLVVIALVAGGLLAPAPWNGLVMLVVAALLVWLVFLSWPAIRPPAKVIRVVVIALVIGYALSQLV